MLKLRRSLRNDPKLHASIPPKDAIAIVPPKKVIKALYDCHDRQSSDCLPFKQGDFLHVVGREDDLEWYEACNPLHGTRGLVPVDYFETVGKTVRNSGSSARSDVAHPNAGHDSGYAEKTSDTSDSSSNNYNTMARSPPSAKHSGAMVYGVVMYDFKAERPDELEAKEGEAIIVIAQSNPEWFVAKPITRLGGPGLIPVSFIEIRDMTTGRPVPDPHEAVRAAGVPRVEEWKRMAAEYKNGSIPLGKLESNQAATVLPLQQRPQAKPKLLAPVSASVPRYCFSNDIFSFTVECQMDDGSWWELSRLYQEFYDLQIKLLNAFPIEAGQVEGIDRTLPYMPGPVTYVTDNITNGRRANLHDYITNLLRLGPHITHSDPVYHFFRPKEDDYEIDPNIAADPCRLSGASQLSVNQSTDPSRQSSTGNLQHSYYSHSADHRRQPSNHHAHSLHPQNPDPRIPRNDSSLTQASVFSAGQGSFLKVKVWFGRTVCAKLRIPANATLMDLQGLLKARYAIEPDLDPNEASTDSFQLTHKIPNEINHRYINDDGDLALALQSPNPVLHAHPVLPQQSTTLQAMPRLQTVSPSTC